jgi:pimeloyl-ACP methyl ester carboxylesterase
MLFLSSSSTDVSADHKHVCDNLTSINILGPGSFIEVRKVLPLLIEVSPQHPSFHVVALSLPGYGFSEAPKKKGFEVAQMAEVWRPLLVKDVQR